MNELPFLELIRERIYKFGRNSNNLLWRQEKLLNMFSSFEKSLDIYIDNQNFLKEQEDLKKKAGKPGKKQATQKALPTQNHLYEDEAGQ